MNAREQRRLIVLAQSLAMQAMEFPSDQRQAVIEQAVTQIRRDYEQEHGADPSTATQAHMLLALTQALMRIIEECGGQVGHA